MSVLIASCLFCCCPFPLVAMSTAVLDSMIECLEFALEVQGYLVVWWRSRSDEVLGEKSQSKFTIIDAWGRRQWLL